MHSDMLKKIGSALAGTAVILSAYATAQAALPGFYMGMELRYGGTGVQKALEQAYAVHLDSPTGKDKELTKTLNTLKVKNNTPISGRLTLGYQLNDSLATEMGYTYVPITDPHTSDTSAAAITFQGAHIADIAIKIILPVGSLLPYIAYVNLFMKPGIAYVFYPNHTAKLAELDGPVMANKFAPELTLGISYDMTPNWAFHLSGTHIHPLGDKNQGVHVIEKKSVYPHLTPEPINVLSMGVNYNFG